MKQARTPIKRVFSLRVAHELRIRGHYILYTEPNPKKPGLLVYIFEQTPEFEKDFATILNHK